MDETNRLQSPRRVIQDQLEQFGLENVLHRDPPLARSHPTQILEFELNDPLTTSDTDVEATVVLDGVAGDTITVWNPKKTDATYVFSGAAGSWGVAYLRSDGKLVIIQLQC